MSRREEVIKVFESITSPSEVVSVTPIALCEIAISLADIADTLKEMKEQKHDEVSE